MEKKKLKKLIINKEEIVNLNEYQMGSKKGGTLTFYTASVGGNTATATADYSYDCPDAVVSPECGT